MVIAESPTPDLPRGAGGSLRRAAGRVLPPRGPAGAPSEGLTGAASEEPAEAASQGQAALGPEHTALVLEPDPLGRLLAVSAVSALGLRVLPAPDEARRRGAALPPAAVVFVPLARTADCRAVCAAAGARSRMAELPAPLVVGYGAGPAALLAAHRAHGCADLVLLLTVAGGGARFAHLPAVDDVSAAGLTRREADVLVLLLAGLTTPQVARRLGVSSSTARTHCRAVLRKLGVGDRRALRARLLAGRGTGPEVCLGGHANFAEE